MPEPIWVLSESARHIHRDQIDQFGGMSGVRDEGMLESALDRPRNLWHYGEPTLAEMASAYAFGVAKNHPFVDGNKRPAFVVSVLFLELNGVVFQGTEENVATTFLALGAGELDEEALAVWFAQNVRSL